MKKEDLTLEFFNIKDLPKENVRSITPPFDTDENLDIIEEYFIREQENKPKLYFDINYKESKVKGIGLLTSIINLGISTDINFKEVNFLEKEKIFKEYLSLNSYGCIPSLTCTLCSLVFRVKGFKNLNFNSIFSKEEELDFINNNKETLDKVTLFLDSLLLFLYKISPAKDSFNLEKYPTNDNTNYVGKNIVSIFNIKDFFYYYAAPIEDSKLVNFTYYFDNSNHCFAGKNLFSRFINKYNIQAQIMHHLSTTKDINRCIDFIKQANNLS